MDGADDKGHAHFSCLVDAAAVAVPSAELFADVAAERLAAVAGAAPSAWTPVLPAAAASPAAFAERFAAVTAEGLAAVSVPYAGAPAAVLAAAAVASLVVFAALVYLAADADSAAALVPDRCVALLVSQPRVYQNQNHLKTLMTDLMQGTRFVLPLYQCSP